MAEIAWEDARASSTGVRSSNNASRDKATILESGPRMALKIPPGGDEKEEIRGSADYWKREAEQARLNLRILQQVSKEVMVSQHHDSHGETDIQSLTKTVYDCLEREWEERECFLRAEYEKKLRDLEERHRKDMAHVVEESKRLDSALYYIKGLCDAHDDDGQGIGALVGEGNTDTVVSDTVVHCVDVETPDARGHACESCRIEPNVTMHLSDEKLHEEGLLYETPPFSNDDADDRIAGESVMYARPDAALHTPKDSFCPIIGYRGENPDIITENAMDRILDQPTHEYRGRVYRSVSKHGTGVRDSVSPTWKIPSIHTRTKLIKEIQVLEKRLRQRKVDASSDVITEEGNQPRGNEEEEDEFVRTIKALGETSPTTANVMIQHVTDSWAVQKHAFKDHEKEVRDMKCRKDGNRKSSFLERQPISITEVFSSATPMWRSH